MNANSLFHALIHVIVLRCLGKIDLNRESTARNRVDLGTAEEVRELIGIHSGRRDNDLDISSSLSHFDQDAKEHIGMQGAFMGFVHDNAGILFQIRVIQ